VIEKENKKTRKEKEKKKKERDREKRERCNFSIFHRWHCV
jgi:hypothetical protein